MFYNIFNFTNQKLEFFTFDPVLCPTNLWTLDKDQKLQNLVFFISRDFSFFLLEFDTLVFIFCGLCLNGRKFIFYFTKP